MPKMCYYCPIMRDSEKAILAQGSKSHRFPRGLASEEARASAVNLMEDDALRSGPLDSFGVTEQQWSSLLRVIEKALWGSSSSGWLL